MVAAALVLHTFGGNSMFGLAIVSVIPAIVLGYAQQSLHGAKRPNGAEREGKIGDWIIARGLPRP